MILQHPQERILQTFNYNGVKIDLTEWTATIWCGKLGFAATPEDEPDIEEVMQKFLSLDIPASLNAGRENGWDVCISLNYLSHERPHGVMFGFLVGKEQQPAGYDILKFPASLYMRIPLCSQTSRALGFAPWHGGIPPYEWIGEYLASKYGYQYGDSNLPILEYYGYYNKFSYKFCYLYVPVMKS